MTKHTPGTWSNRGNRIIDQQEYEVATVSTRANFEANARLIASAPELLEACKEALKTLEFLKEYEPRPRNATNKLQQAIAKAEGTNA